MFILFGLLFLVWVGGFGFLWVWAQDNVDSWWGAMLPIGWMILTPCIVVQLIFWLM